MSAWVSVEERMPEVGQFAIVYYRRITGNSFVCVASRHKPFDDMDLVAWYNSAGEIMGGTVTHWMEFPEVPQ